MSDRVMNWSTRDYVFVGIIASIIGIIQALATVAIAIGGLGSGGPVMLIVTPLFSIICIRIINKKFAIFLMAAVLSIMFLPLPALGPPGFIPKIGLILIAAAIFEGSYWGLKTRFELIASIGSSAIFGGIVLILFVAMIQFVIPADMDISVGPVIELGYVVALLGVILGGLGGYIGERIYQKIKDRPAVARVQNQ